MESLQPSGVRKTKNVGKAPKQCHCDKLRVANKALEQGQAVLDHRRKTRVVVRKFAAGNLERLIVVQLSRMSAGRRAHWFISLMSLSELLHSRDTLETYP